MFCHLVRQVRHVGQERRVFPSFARPGVAVMSRSFCLCTDRNGAFEGTQGVAIGAVPIALSSAVEACVLWRRSCLDSCFVLHRRFEGLRMVSSREFCGSVVDKGLARSGADLGSLVVASWA